MTSAVEITKVAKQYGETQENKVIALEDTNLELRDKEFFSLVGPSGCGKTTLLNIVAGLVDATTGNVEIAGDPVKGPSRNTSIVFQKATLLNWLTVAENVLLPDKIKGTKTPETLQRCDALLDVSGLGDFKQRHPRQLSGGMQALPR